MTITYQSYSLQNFLYGVLEIQKKIKNMKHMQNRSEGKSGKMLFCWLAEAFAHMSVVRAH